MDQDTSQRTADDLTDVRYRQFSDGALWYFGELMRRAHGGLWDDVAERPYLRKLGKGHNRLDPVFALKRAVDKPGHLRWCFEEYA